MNLSKVSEKKSCLFVCVVFFREKIVNVFCEEKIAVDVFCGEKNAVNVFCGDKIGNNEWILFSRNSFNHLTPNLSFSCD